MNRVSITKSYIMKKLKKLRLEDSDLFLLNDENMKGIMGGEDPYCPSGDVIYNKCPLFKAMGCIDVVTCATLEIQCGPGFTIDTGCVESTCPSGFSSCTKPNRK